MKRSYEQRLRIPLEGGSLELYTARRTLIANGFERVVIGGRGPYIEFAPGQVIASLNYSKTPHYYYKEAWVDGVKVYDQLHRVKYADYIPGRLYMSPFDLVLSDGRTAIETRGEGQLSLL